MSHAVEFEEGNNVEVERKPSLNGWDFFQAIDAVEERERWTIALKHTRGSSPIEYAFWRDPKKDPDATGALEPSHHAKALWAIRVRDALKGSNGEELDDLAREELILTILQAHDTDFQDYEQRIVFDFEPPEQHGANDDNDDANDDDDDD